MANGVTRDLQRTLLCVLTSPRAAQVVRSVDMPFELGLRIVCTFSNHDVYREAPTDEIDGSVLRLHQDNLTMITEAIAAGFEQAEIEKPLRMQLTGASWTAIGSLAAICLGFIRIVLWAVDTVRSKNQKPTLSDLTAATIYQQHVAASGLSSEEKRAAESRATGLAVLINREVDKLLARERGGGRFGGWVGREWKKLKRGRRLRALNPLSWIKKSFRLSFALIKRKTE